MSPDLHTVEGIARVVCIVGDVAWLEPEQTTSCGSCASAAACGSGATGIGTVASRIEARRFAIDNPADLKVGERVVVGIGDRALIKATLTAYVVPLITAFAAAGFAESTWGSDLATMAAMVAGLGAGLLLARIGARHLGARGELAPHFLRRAPVDSPRSRLTATSPQGAGNTWDGPACFPAKPAQRTKESP